VYKRQVMGFDGHSCAVLNAIGKQSPDIAQGVDREEARKQGAGDQGLMFGYATNETDVLMPAPITYSHRLVRRQSEVRKSGKLPWLRPDAKSQVTIRYDGDKPARIDAVVLSTQHDPDIAQSDLHEAVMEEIIRPVLPAEWLGNEIRDRWVIAVAGTHGKTTTTSMIAWILEHAGLEPGYLIGGVPSNFERSARLGSDPFFVVEADEYDTSYFDRRSKFVHYRPRTLVINNLEYDHADIFPDLAAIQTQFHHLVRTVPGSGLIIAPSHDDHVQETLQRGCWTPVCRFGPPPARQPLEQDNGERFEHRVGDRIGLTHRRDVVRLVIKNQPHFELVMAVVAADVVYGQRRSGDVSVPSGELFQAFFELRLQAVGEFNRFRVILDGKAGCLHLERRVCLWHNDTPYPGFS